MTKTYIGIDPGKSGAFAALFPDGRVVTQKWTEPDDVAEGLRSVLSACALRVSVAMEHVHAMPGQGVTSMFTFGENYGWWQGVCFALSVPVYKVRPREWQAGISGRQGKRGADLKRYLKSEAAARFPTETVTLATADALLIADWARREGL